jgi:hypothetical protein
MAVVRRCDYESASGQKSISFEFVPGRWLNGRYRNGIRYVDAMSRTILAEMSQLENPKDELGPVDGYSRDDPHW